jgi:hypothetical protein
MDELPWLDLGLRRRLPGVPAVRIKIRVDAFDEVASADSMRSDVHWLRGFSAGSSALSLGHGKILIPDCVGSLRCPATKFSPEVCVLRLREQKLDAPEGALRVREPEIGPAIERGVGYKRHAKPEPLAPLHDDHSVTPSDVDMKLPPLVGVISSPPDHQIPAWKTRLPVS